MKRSIILLLAALGAFMGLQAQSDDEIVGSSGDITLPHMSLSAKDNDMCSSFFLEGTLLLGSDIDGTTPAGGAGLSVAYLPQHFGAYGTANLMRDGIEGSIGLAWRPFTHSRIVDWQLFAGPAFYHGVGFEGGMRFSATKRHNRGEFSWMSASVSYVSLPRWQFVSIGLSIDFSYLWGLFVII